MVNSKKCFKCESIKPLNDFYKHKQMADGHLNKCKTCAKRDSLETRNNNIDYYLEYDRSRSMLPHRVVAREHYSKTENGKASHRKSRSKWLESNLIKRAAHVLVGNAVRDKKIEKPTECSLCQKSGVRIHGHHDNYAEPLNVRWLCSKCHTQWHKENGEGLSL